MQFTFFIYNAVVPAETDDYLNSELMFFNSGGHLFQTAVNFCGVSIGFSGGFNIYTWQTNVNFLSNFVVKNKKFHGFYTKNISDRAVVKAI